MERRKDEFWACRRLLPANIFNLFLKEVFLRSVILFQPDFCFMNEDLRFRLRSWEIKRCGKVDKKNCSSLEMCLGARCAGHPTNVHHPRRTRMGKDWPVMPVYSDTISPARMGHYRDYVGSLPPILLVAYCSF
jgi:hypothetical protein